MKLTRGKRIALEFLGPPLLGGVAATLWAWGLELHHSLYRYESIWEAVGQLRTIPVLWLLYGMFAFPMIGGQAACYTAIMEWRFKRGLDPRGWWAVALASTLGYLSGLPLAIGYGFERKDTWWFFNLVGPCGRLGARAIDPALVAETRQRLRLAMNGWPS
jgi:hypothetical protein